MKIYIPLTLLAGLLLPTSSWAIPLLTIEPITKAPSEILVGKSAIAQYRVINNSNRKRTEFTVINLPPAITQDTSSGCASKFNLEAKANCILTLTINPITSGIIDADPKICYKASEAYCYRPANNADRIHVTATASPPPSSPELEANTSSLLLPPNVVKTITTTNKSDSVTARNVRITIPTIISDDIESTTYTGCDSIAPKGTCQINIKAKLAANVDDFPVNATIQGANTKPATIQLDLDAPHIQASDLTINEPTTTIPSNITITNLTSESVRIDNVTFGSGLNNISLKSGIPAACQNIVGKETACQIPITAETDAYGQGNATIAYTYNNKERTIISSISVANTTVSFSSEIRLERGQSGQTSEITNNGKFDWQIAYTSLASSKIKLTSSTCTSTINPTNACTVTFDTNQTPLPDYGDSAILSITGDNITTTSSNVVVNGGVAFTINTDEDKQHLGYRAITVQNLSADKAYINKVDIATSLTNKIKFCSKTDTDCTRQSTCDVTETNPEPIYTAGSCLIWMQALSPTSETSFGTATGAATITYKHPSTEKTKIINITYNRDLYAGGLFTKAGSENTNKIAKWDGLSWSALTSEAIDPTTSIVLTLKSDKNGDLIAGGTFTTIGSITTLNRIARWNGASWKKLVEAGVGLNAEVRSLALDKNNDLILGGDFTSVNGDATLDKLVRWNGTNWLSVNTSTMGGDVYSLIKASSDSVDSGATFKAGDIIATGSISFGGSYKIFKWDYSNWAVITNPFGSFGSQEITSILEYKSGELLAGGDFIIGGTRLAKWNASGWATVTGINNGSVYSLVKDNLGNIYIGGTFTTAGGSIGNRIVIWDGAAASVKTVSAGDMNADVRALILNGSQIIASGDFTTAGGFPASRIAKLNGGGWAGIGSGTDNDIYTLIILPSLILN